MSLNQQYLVYLAKYPLLTKLVTAGFFNCLNEIVATAISGDFKETTVHLFGQKITIKHVFSPKILQMMFYGLCIATPISHNLFGILNKVFAGQLSPLMKLAQIAASLLTVTPVLSAVYVLWLSLINGYKRQSCDPKKELSSAGRVVKFGLKNNFWNLYKTSATTTAISVAVAQKYLPPQLWVIFFTVVYFVVGTTQNTRFKLKARKLREKQD